MTKAEIDAVLDRVRAWPPDRQEHVAALFNRARRSPQAPIA
jgi:hypothetical protein